MSQRSTRTRRLLGLGIVLCTAVSAVAGTAAVAQAAKPGTNSRPVATATATVNDDRAQVIVIVNRAASQIRTATCTLDNAAVGCGNPADVGGKTATYSIALTNLTAGTHQLAFSLRLTDGGIATASTSFEVAEPVSLPQACENSGGTLTESFAQWECHWVFPYATDPATLPSDDIIEWLTPACERTDSYEPIQWYGDEDAEGNDFLNVYSTCLTPTSAAARDICEVTPGIGSENASLIADEDSWHCRTASLDQEFVDSLTAICVGSVGTEVEVSPYLEGRTIYCYGPV